MKVKNEYVTIKFGNKIVTKKNMILNKYLKGVIDKQLKENVLNSPYLAFTTAYIKLDTPLDNVTYDSELNFSDFELRLMVPKKTIKNTKNTIEINYKFDNSFWFIYNNVVYMGKDKSVLNNHKIMGVAFGNYKGVYTYLDTKEYNITFQDKELLQIVRKDIYFTNAIIDGFDYPFHLLQDEEYIYLNNDKSKRLYTYLYSIGFGTRIGKIQDEYIIGKNLDIIQDDNFSFRFVLKKAVDNNIYPAVNFYLGNSKYPIQYKSNRELHLTSNSYCSSKLYPLSSNYKYVIYKYKFYYLRYNEDNTEIEGIVETDKEYTMNLYTDKKGILNIRTKIERSEKYEYW